MRVAAIAAPFLATIIAGLTSGLEAAAGSADEPELSGYTCCNFHYEGDWISDANWSSMPMIPAGAPARTLSYFAYRVMVEIDGRKMRLGLDYGRNQRIGEWMRKMIVAEDPRPKIEAKPTPIREAIRAGKVAVGMSKEEVIIALGYPPTHQTLSLDSPQWKYWHTGFGTYLVVWDDAGRVKDVIGDPQTLLGVLAGAAAAAAAPQKAVAAGPAVAPPAAGTQWVYALHNRQFRRLSTEVRVRVARADGETIEELVSIGTATNPARRFVDPRGMQFLEHSFGAVSLVEPPPYFLIASKGKAPVDIAAPNGYPLGDSSQSRWSTTIRAHDWEQVAVPAGNYRALRVEINGRRAADGNQQGTAGQFRMIIWYAPDVNRFVRLEHKVWSGAFSTKGQQIGEDVVELLAYRPPS